MPTNILMPALSPTMEKGNLAKWLVKEGDAVAAGDVIAEIETDKATMEVEAVEEGTVGKIVVPEGTQDIPVNDVIAILLSEGEDPSAIEAMPGKPTASPAQPAPAPAAATGETATAETATSKASTTQDLARQGPATRGEPAPAPQPPANLAAADGRPAGEKSRIFASPLARRLAREAGIDLSAVSGSGPHGRIVQRDVEAAIAGGGKAAAPAASAEASKPTAAAPLAMGDEQIRKLFEEGSYEVVPHDSMRRTIARRLLEAKTTIPHFYLTLDLEIDALLALRQQLNEAAPVKDDKPAYKLSVNDMVIKALALALKAVPEANVTWTEGGMLRHKVVDVGVAVAIPGGLITPIVRRADTKPLSVISNEMKDLAARARDRKLLPNEYQGGSTAVSNLGMYGVKDFAAVINPPHATILAVGAGEQRPVVKNGALAIATVMSVTLSTDHRAVDGALGAELLAAFKGFIEKPLSMLV